MSSEGLIAPVSDRARQPRFFQVSRPHTRSQRLKEVRDRRGKGARSETGAI